jgi:diaminopimelate epimerase
MRYWTMNGAGNEFVVLDTRGQAYAPSVAKVRALAKLGKGPAGADQLIALDAMADGVIRVRFWNCDGEEVPACGNGTRAIAWLAMEESQATTLAIDTAAGRLHAKREGAAAVAVDMGRPRLGWREIPVARETETVRMDFAWSDGVHTLSGPGGVNIGNPHAVFFVAEHDEALIRRAGPEIEHDAFFPERVNVGFARIMAPDHIRLRVWERGAGLTKACGTGACAALVAAHRAGLSGRRAMLELDGGNMTIDWRDDGGLTMSGPVELSGEGVL